MSSHTSAGLQKTAMDLPDPGLPVGPRTSSKATVPVELLLLLQLFVGHQQVASPL